MNIRKELKKIYKKSGSNNLKTIEDYNFRKTIISDYYSKNKDMLINNKNVLIERYSDIFRFSNRNSINVNVMMASIFAGMISSKIFQYFEQIFSFKDPLIAIMSLLILEIILVIIIALFFRLSKQDILNNRLCEYEIDIIEGFLDEDDEKFMVVRVKREI